MEKNNLQEDTDQYYNPCLQQETTKAFAQENSYLMNIPCLMYLYHHANLCYLQR